MLKRAFSLETKNACQSIWIPLPSDYLTHFRFARFKKQNSQIKKNFFLIFKDFINLA